MSDKLLPCPFCGAKRMLSDKSKPGPVMMEYGVMPDPHILCKKCGAQTECFDTREASIAAWNRRAPAAQPAQKQGEDRG